LTAKLPYIKNKNGRKPIKSQKLKWIKTTKTERRKKKPELGKNSSNDHHNSHYRTEQFYFFNKVIQIRPLGPTLKSMSIFDV